MIQVHTCVSVHCDQCRDALGSPECERHYRAENAALDAAAADGWRIDRGGRWWCSACAPALICQVEGHQLSPWRRPLIRNEHPALSEYRYCRRCCVLESRPATPGEGDPR
jgi:hypothetical protein